MGQMVTHAAMLEDRSSTFFPSYGPEMRGGTASCTVIVSDKEVSCPIINEADILVAMNLPSLLKFQPTLKPGGVILLNTSRIDQKPSREDITAIDVPVNDMAAQLGNARVANMIMLGAFVRATGVVAEESIKEVIAATIGAKRADLLDINLKAFDMWKQTA
ncbi:MAG: 2-oxoacid:acceptor oxidoreductase family protein [Oscillospiraceae bacterium]|nr:2-oxoacid:acceptor oxidoreductase family protein [Oscillospiraceae bacterium]